MGRLTIGAAIFTMCVVSASGADVDALLKDLKAKDAKTRQKAVESLAGVPVKTQVTTAICNATCDLDADVALSARLSLEKVRPDLCRLLSTLLLDKDQKVRASAASDLGKLRQKARPAVGAMAIIMLRDAQNPLARQPGDHYYDPVLMTAKAIKTIGVTDEEVAKIMAVVANNSVFINARTPAMEAISAWAKNEKGEGIMFPALKAWFADAPQYQAAACKIAGEFGRPAKEEFGTTIENLKSSSDQQTREAAIQAFDKLSK